MSGGGRDSQSIAFLSTPGIGGDVVLQRGDGHGNALSTFDVSDVWRNAADRGSGQFRALRHERRGGARHRECDHSAGIDGRSEHVVPSSRRRSNAQLRVTFVLAGGIQFA